MQTPDLDALLQQQINQYAVAEAEYRVSPDDIAIAKRRVSNWRRYYPDWRDGDVREADYLAGLAARRFYASPTPDNRAAAGHAVIVAFLASGQLRPIEEFIPDPPNQRGLTFEEMQRRRAHLLRQVIQWLDVVRIGNGNLIPDEVQIFLLRQAVQRFYAIASPANLSAATHAAVIACYAYGRERTFCGMIETDASGKRYRQLRDEVERWLENAGLIPRLADQNLCAQDRSPKVMMRHG